MSTEPQPEVRWAPLPPKPKGRWHIWLIVGLAALVVAALVVFLVFVLPGSFRPEPKPTVSASPSATPSSTPDATPTQTPTLTSTPSPTTMPPVDDPSISQFAGTVAPWLDDAVDGLRYASESGGESAASDIELLQQDAERLSDATAPDAIASDWTEGVRAYADALRELYDAYQSDSGVASAEDAAQSALQELRALVGL